MAVSVMIKPASSKCNLRCKYCFYCDVSNNRAETDKGFMTLETAENVIKKALSFGRDSVSFTFQGGEPLLAGIDFFKKFVSIVDKQNADGTLSVSYFLQTNATLIDDEWCRFFKENNFLLGVSLDGNEEQNRYRVYKDGRSSFDDVVSSVDLLKKYGVNFNIVSVLTKQLANSFRDSYKFFKSIGADYLQYIPCINDFNEVDEYSMDNDDYVNYLNSAFKIYYNSKMRNAHISIRQFDNYCLLCRNQNAEQCGMNGVCSNQFVVEGDGSVYPCDFYCIDDFYLGNINDTDFEEMYNSPVTVEFIKDSFKLKEECKNCDVFYLCRGGGCKRNRESFDYCRAYKQFFSANAEKLSKITSAI